MKNIYRNIIIAAAAAAAVVSCAKATAEGKNVAKKRAFDAYMQVHYPGVGSVGYGTYILEDYPGNGLEVEDSNYVFIRFISRNISDNSILAYTDESTAKQLGEFTGTADYSPYILCLCPGSVSQGILDLFKGGEEVITAGNGTSVKGRTFGRMRIGSRRVGIMPSWLTSTSFYYTSGNPKDYLDNVDEGTNYFYDITVVDQTKDIEQWQIDSIRRYMAKEGMVTDTVHFVKGMYYWRNRIREYTRGVTVLDSVRFPKDTTVYINYIGRLLNGKVFDTNIEDTAKVWGLYKSTGSYNPARINWDSDSTKLTMNDETSVITGFSYTLWNMHPFESGSGIFTSSHGYGSNGSGLSIPAYAPLIFEIDIVEDPDK